MASQNASAAIVVHHKVAVHHKDHIASSQASATAVAVHHKVRTASQGTISVHKVVTVIPETHGASAPELLKIMKTTKGNVIGGTITKDLPELEKIVRNRISNIFREEDFVSTLSASYSALAKSTGVGQNSSIWWANWNNNRTGIPFGEHLRIK
jgi:hypothetical protein